MLKFCARITGLQVHIERLYLECKNVQNSFSKMLIPSFQRKSKINIHEKNAAFRVIFLWTCRKRRPNVYLPPSPPPLSLFFLLLPFIPPCYPPIRTTRERERSGRRGRREEKEDTKSDNFFR